MSIGIFGKKGLQRYHCSIRAVRMENKNTNDKGAFYNDPTSIALSI